MIHIIYVCDISVVLMIEPILKILKKSVFLSKTPRNGFFISRFYHYFFLTSLKAFETFLHFFKFHFE